MMSVVVMQFLAVCYQLVQSVLNTGVALVKNGGMREVGGTSCSPEKHNNG